MNSLKKQYQEEIQMSKDEMYELELELRNSIITLK